MRQIVWVEKKGTSKEGNEEGVGKGKRREKLREGVRREQGATGKN